MYALYAREILQESAWNEFRLTIFFDLKLDENPRSSQLLVLTFRKWLELESHFGFLVAL